MLVDYSFSLFTLINSWKSLKRCFDTKDILHQLNCSDLFWLVLRQCSISGSRDQKTGIPACSMSEGNARSGITTDMSDYKRPKENVIDDKSWQEESESVRNKTIPLIRWRGVFFLLLSIVIFVVDNLQVVVIGCVESDTSYCPISFYIHVCSGFVYACSLC